MCYMLYDPNYMTFWKRQNYRDKKKISGCQREDSPDEEVNQSVFRAVKPFCVTL